MSTSSGSGSGANGVRRRALPLLLVLLLIGVSAIVWIIMKQGTADTSVESESRPAAVSSAAPTSAVPSISVTPTPSAGPSDPTAQSSPTESTGSVSTPSKPNPDAKPSPNPVVSLPASASASPLPARDASKEAKLAKVDQALAEPVSLNETATVTDGITAEISSPEAVRGEALGIGEISGPSIRFTLTVHNGTKEPITTGSAVVTVRAGENDVPASSVSGPGVVLLPDTIAAGKSGMATYVYLVPVDQRSRVRINFNYDVDYPIAAFEGSAPKTEGKP